MSVKVAINGFGRMGRLGLRAGLGDPDFQVVALNEIAGNLQTAAHLLEFDSVHGRWTTPVAAEGSTLVAGGQRLAFGAADYALDMGDYTVNPH